MAAHGIERHSLLDETLQVALWVGGNWQFVVLALFKSFTGPFRLVVFVVAALKNQNTTTFYFFFSTPSTSK